MPKVWRIFAVIGIATALPQASVADGVNAGLADPQVIPAPGATGSAGAQTGPLSATGQATVVLPGSNQVGRPGVSPDQIGGYDVNIAYDHVAVGLAVVGVLFLMTEWMEAR